MNNEQITNLIESLVCKRDGKPYQYRNALSGEEWRDAVEKQWPDLLIREGYEVRPKPVPKTRRWSKPSDLPIGICYIRDKGKGDADGFSTVLSANSYGFSRVVSLHSDNTTSQIKRAAWFDCDEFEHSTDRKTWHPCEIVEDNA